MSSGTDDPLKIYKEGASLYDSGKFDEALDKFLQAYKLYEKLGNFFDASYSLFKAAECSYLVHDYKTAIDRFIQAADISFKNGYDRFGLGALEYAYDGYKAAGEEDKTGDLKKKISDLKEKLLV